AATSWKSRDVDSYFADASEGRSDCQTSPMAANGEKLGLSSGGESVPPIGPREAGESRFGPISPELVLVDPALAEWARRQLPEHPGQATGLFRAKPSESAAEAV